LFKLRCKRYVHRFVIEFEFIAFILPLIARLAAVEVTSGSKSEWFFISKTGEKVITCQEGCKAQPFRDGWALLECYEEMHNPYSKKYTTFINQDGHYMPK
jgi:hypothetical protein